MPRLTKQADGENSHDRDMPHRFTSKNYPERRTPSVSRNTRGGTLDMDVTGGSSSSRSGGGDGEGTRSWGSRTVKRCGAAPSRAIGTTSPRRTSPANGTVQQQPPPSRRTPGPLNDWLLSLNNKGALLQYKSPLEDFFDAPEQLFLAYTTPATSSEAPAFDSRFFVEVGVTDKGHQVIFEDWFMSRLAVHGKGKTVPQTPSLRAKKSVVPSEAKKAKKK